MVSLGEAFLDYVHRAPDAPGITAPDLMGDSGSLSRGQLAGLAAQYAASLRTHGVSRGRSVVIALSSSLEFVAVFWAVQLVGAVAVPVPAPNEVERRRDAGLELLARLTRACRAAAIVSNDHGLLQQASLAGVPVIAGHRPTASAEPALLQSVSESDLALIQFTSGSTQIPKGCALSHSAVLLNGRTLVDRCGVAEGDTGVSWLPLHHDMGLMSGVVTPVLGGAASHLIPPQRFMANPTSWLTALSAYDRTHTAAPNFALAVTLQRVERRPPLDARLEGVATILCGAEPIDPGLVRRFLDVLAPYGLRRTAFHAAYGMSELTVLGSGRPGGLEVDVVSKAALQQLGIARPPETGEEAMEIVNLGRPQPGAVFRVVNASGETLADRSVGDVEFRSPSRMLRYVGQRGATRTALARGWLRTGDVGYAVGGELFLTGRAKDIMIIGGRNIVPSDVEQFVASRTNLPAYRIAAFGAPNTLGTQEIHLVVESRREAAGGELLSALKQACFEATGAIPRSVSIVAPGEIPRTTSGKVRRELLRASPAGASRREAELPAGQVRTAALKDASRLQEAS